MGQWLATIQFPDGSRTYARYSTEVESLLPDLFAAMVPRGGPFPDGSICYRSEVFGDRLPARPDAEPAGLGDLGDLGDLVPMMVSTEPDRETWHALYCPRRALLLGPMSAHHRYALQRRFELVADASGVRHLRPASALPAGADRSGLWPARPRPAGAVPHPVPIGRWDRIRGRRRHRSLCPVAAGRRVPRVPG